MLLGGDEVRRTQRGNNNGYCQDISWFDWSAPDQDLLGFTRKLVRLRRAHPVFRRRRFLTGVEADELSWYTPAGTRMRRTTGATPTPSASRCTSTAPTIPTRRGRYPAHR
jgi:glycogen operon protein